MPQLVKLQKDYKDQGFTIIANHAQNIPKDEVVTYLRSAKVNFTVTSGGRVDVPNRLSGIPAAYLFDSSGKLVLSGRPATMKQQIIDLIQSEPHFLAAGRSYKKLGKIAASLKRSKAYASILKKLDKEEKKGGEAAEEAAYLSSRIRNYGKDRYLAAKKLERSDAFGAMSIYNELKVTFKGEKAGDKADERIKALKKNKEFQTELKAGEIAAKILAECEKLTVPRGRSKPDLSGGQNKRIAGKVRGMMAVLLKRYGETNAAKKAKADLKDYGFSF